MDLDKRKWWRMQNLKLALLEFSLFFMMIFNFSCSSSSSKLKEVDHSSTIKKDYIVRDASSDIRPGWIEDANLWASQNGLEVKSYKFFSYETGPHVHREMACDLAKARARVDIASEISSFIKKSLARYQEGQSEIDENDPITKGLKKYLSSDLSERIQSMIHGVSVIKTYWEKRNYQVKRGAKKNYMGYTCASFVKIPKELLKNAIRKASEDIQVQSSPELKEKVQKSLENLEKNFTEENDA